MTRGVAPSALRRPISRIRSVTETSMMFMTPMPPTSSEIAGDPAEQHGQRARRSRWRSATIDSWLLIVKSAVGAR